MATNDLYTEQEFRNWCNEQMGENVIMNALLSGDLKEMDKLDSCQRARCTLLEF